MTSNKTLGLIGNSGMFSPALPVQAREAEMARGALRRHLLPFFLVICGCVFTRAGPTSLRGGSPRALRDRLNADPAVIEKNHYITPPDSTPAPGAITPPLQTLQGQVSRSTSLRQTRLSSHLDRHASSLASVWCCGRPWALPSCPCSCPSPRLCSARRKPKGSSEPLLSLG